jgi:hypothetical protein
MDVQFLIRQTRENPRSRYGFCSRRFRYALAWLTRAEFLTNRNDGTV